MIKTKVKKLKELKKIIFRCKKQGERIAFANGCFDILHLGHVRYLEQASSLGDKLVVAINSDTSVRKIKGSCRPLNPAKDRACLVAALKCVDYVIIFAQTTPFKLIKALRPNILVKGGDWRPSDVVGRNFVQSYAGKVVCVDFIKGYSTSSLITKISKAQTYGASHRRSHKRRT